MSLDWEYSQGKLLIFDSYRELAHDLPDRYDLVTSNSDNTLYVMYSHDTHNLMQVYRDRYREHENVYEDYIDVNVDRLIPGKRILGLHIVNDTTLFLVFEGGSILSTTLMERFPRKKVSNPK